MDRTLPCSSVGTPSDVREDRDREGPPHQQFLGAKSVCRCLLEILSVGPSVDPPVYTRLVQTPSSAFNNSDCLVYH